MLKTLKGPMRRLLGSLGYEIRRTESGRATAAVSYSHLDEQSIASRYLRQLEPQSDFCVDIGASDGVKMSNTYALFRDGWTGVAVECDPGKFSDLARTYRPFPEVALVKSTVRPASICALLEGVRAPKRLAFLSLDIDGYDYFVLEKVLERFRPALICAEINEKIPPPVKFTVRYRPDYSWSGDHFYGMSIAQLHELGSAAGYSLVELHYNNAFLVPEEVDLYPALTPVEAFTRGYLERPDRREKFPWNADMEALLEMTPEAVVASVHDLFAAYERQFACSL